MKKVKPRLTINQSEYMKELNRIKRFIKNAEKKGYNFGNYNPPEMPKRVTKKAIQTLRNIKPKDLYAKATYYDVITDSVISGTEARKKLRKKYIRHNTKKYPKINKIQYTIAGIPPSIVDNILTDVEELISTWQPLSNWTNSYAKLKEKDKNILQRNLAGAISQLGRDVVAKNMESRAADVKEAAFHICYGNSDFKWGDINGELAAINAIIRGKALTVDEAKSVQDDIDEVLGYEDPE